MERINLLMIKEQAFNKYKGKHWKEMEEEELAH
jgi:hypothetical protein